MKEPVSEAEIVRDMIADLREGIAQLEDERDVMDWRIQEKKDRLRWFMAKQGLTDADSRTERKRAPRGANLKSIVTLLLDPASPRQGLSSSEIVAKTNLSFSSVQAALKQGDESGLVEQVDGFWRPKSESKPDEGDSAGMETRNGNVN
jgi:hypothetical protein